MEVIRKFINRIPIVSFLVITFIWTFSWWSLLLLFIKPGGLLNDKLSITSYLIYFFGGLGPSLAAFLLIIISDGLTGVKNLLHKMAKLKPVYIFFIFVFIIPVILQLSTIYFFKLFGIIIGTDKFTAMIIPAVFIGLISGVMEEFGWRGYLLPLLQNKFSPFLSTMIVGLFWGIWNFIPTYLSIGNFKIYFIPCFMLFCPVMLTGYSIIFSVIYNKTKGNMIFPILLHAAMTASSVIFNVASQNPLEYLYILIFQSVIIWIIASIFLSIFGMDMGYNRVIEEINNEIA
jgi:hypothetical protein